MNKDIATSTLNDFIDAIIDIHRDRFSTAHTGHTQSNKCASFATTDRRFIDGALKDAYRKQCSDDLKNLFIKFDLSKKQTDLITNAIGWVNIKF